MSGGDPLGANQSYAIAPGVVHETIDGEVIVIDLATGTYFSLQGGAAAVWALVVAGQRSLDMVPRLADAYSEDADSIRSVLDTFLAQLTSESLLTIATHDVVHSNGVPHLTATGPFSPRLEKYTDMTELILLDPVHDVDSIGWPHLPADDDK